MLLMLTSIFISPFKPLQGDFIIIIILSTVLSRFCVPNQSFPPKYLFLKKKKFCFKFFFFLPIVTRSHVLHRISLYGVATSSFEYSTEFPMLDGSGRYINLCSVPHGGRKCSSDAQCGGMGGLCISGHCVCPDGYLCGNCAVLVCNFFASTAYSY